MTETVYIELKVAQTVDGDTGTSKYRVNLSPIDTIDDTYKNQLDAIPDEELDDPISIVINTKRISHFVTINGLLIVNSDDAALGVTDLLPDPASAEKLQDPTSKLGRLRILMGYGAIDNSLLTLYINGLSYEGYISRLTTIPTGGQVNFMDFIIEFIEGEAY